MKHLICVAVCLSLVFSLCACQDSREDVQVPASFYYRTVQAEFNTESGIISGEIRETKSVSGDLRGMIDLYLKGPQSDELVSPFPADIRVEALSQEEEILQIVLSPEFAELSGFKLTIACACLSMTVMEQTQCSAVEISAKDSLLDGSESITMSKENLLLLDQADTND